MVEKIVKPVKPNYVYLGTEKVFYLSYAFCPCGQYLGSRERTVCSSCNSSIDWSEMPYLKTAKDFKK